jgi:hypothetical protein
MLRSVAIGPGWAKKAGRSGRRGGVFDRIETSGAEGLKTAFIVGANPDVVDGLVRSAVLDDEVGAPVDGERIELADIENRTR